VKGEIKKTLSGQAQRLKRDVQQWEGQFWMWYAVGIVLPVMRELSLSAGAFPGYPPFLASEAQYNAMIQHAQKVLRYASPGESIFLGAYGALNSDAEEYLNDLPDPQAVNKTFDDLASFYENLSADDNLNRWLFARETGSLDDLEKIYLVMWFYAARIPHDEPRFARASELYRRAFGETYPVKDGRFAELSCLDGLLAKIKSVAKLGGGVDGLRGEIWAWADHFIEKKDEKTLSNLASGLCWLNLTKYEHDLLNKMFANGIPMKQEIQERLQFLNTIGDKVPKAKDWIDKNALAFDNESLSWDKGELASFFNALAMQKRPLSYALSMNDWTPDAKLAIEKGAKWDNDEVYARIAEEIDGQYDDEVTCERRSLTMLTSVGNDNYEGLLLTREGKEYAHLGLFVYIHKEGRRINPHIYTLLLPIPEADAKTMKEAGEYAAALKAVVSGENVSQKIKDFIVNVQDIVANALGKVGAKKQEQEMKY
jgi:hypothetical protein